MFEWNLRADEDGLPAEKNISRENMTAGLFVLVLENRMTNLNKTGLYKLQCVVIQWNVDLIFFLAWAFKGQTEDED